MEAAVRLVEERVQGAAVGTPPDRSFFHGTHPYLGLDVNIEYDAKKGIVFRVPRKMTPKALDRAKAAAWRFYTALYLDAVAAENPVARHIAGAVEALKANRVREVVDQGIQKEIDARRNGETVPLDDILRRV